MFEQQVDHRIRPLVVGGLESEFLEVLVLSEQFARLIRKQERDPLQRAAVERLLDVFDDVELDVALAQDVQRAARLPSAGVVVDEHFLHLEDLRDWIPGFGDREASRPSSSLQAPLQFVRFICSRR